MSYPDMPEWSVEAWLRAVGALDLAIDAHHRRNLRLVALWAVGHLDEVVYQDATTEEELTYDGMVRRIWAELPPVGWTPEQVHSVWEHQRHAGQPFDPSKFDLIHGQDGNESVISGWIGEPPVGTGASEKRHGLYLIRLDRNGDQV